MAIIDELLAPERRRIQAMVDKMVVRNREVTGKPQDGFLFMGKAYRPTNYPLGRPTLVTLDMSLESEMLTIIRDQAQVESDVKEIQQLLHILISKTKTAQDIRDVLPECLIQFTSDNVKNLSREREEAFLVKDDEHVMRQLAKARDRMEYYAVAGLLY